MIKKGAPSPPLSKRNGAEHTCEQLTWNPHFSQPMMEEIADLNLEKFFSSPLVDVVLLVTPDLEEQQEADTHHESESEMFARVNQKLKDKAKCWCVILLIELAIVHMHTHTHAHTWTVLNWYR